MLPLLFCMVQRTVVLKVCLLLVSSGTLKIAVCPVVALLKPWCRGFAAGSSRDTEKQSSSVSVISARRVKLSSKSSITARYLQELQFPTCLGYVHCFSELLVAQEPLLITTRLRLCCCGLHITYVYRNSCYSNLDSLHTASSNQLIFLSSKKQETRLFLN